MKIRIKGNSIRFRLTKTEVQTLAKEGNVMDETSFPSGNTFRYSLTSSNARENHVSFEDGEISVSLSSSWVKEWSENDVVGTSFETPSKNGTLSVLVEKDFNCLVTREGEDESDHFENPLNAHPAC